MQFAVKKRLLFKKCNIFAYILYFTVDGKN